jgi:hypothetical protein
VNFPFSEAPCSLVTSCEVNFFHHDHS